MYLEYCIEMLDSRNQRGGMPARLLMRGRKLQHAVDLLREARSLVANLLILVICAISNPNYNATASARSKRVLGRLFVAS
jgi:hypothetical protein